MVYLVVGQPPAGGAEWLRYGADKASVWWAIVALSVVTDLLFVPLAFALYRALKSAGRDEMLFATALACAFVALDLAVTWPNFAALITLSERYNAATDIQRAAYIAAADYASAVLKSTLEAVYSIATLSLAILVTSIVMRRGAVFGRAAAYAGIAAGVLGLVSVFGAIALTALGTVVVVASILTTAWVIIVGYRLLRAAGI